MIRFIASRIALFFFFPVFNLQLLLLTYIPFTQWGTKSRFPFSWFAKISILKLDLHKFRQDLYIQTISQDVFNRCLRPSKNLLATLPISRRKKEPFIFKAISEIPSIDIANFILRVNRKFCSGVLIASCKSSLSKALEVGGTHDVWESHENCHITSILQVTSSLL